MYEYEYKIFITRMLFQVNSLYCREDEISSKHHLLDKKFTGKSVHMLTRISRSLLGSTLCFDAFQNHD